jgi:putative CocE/NonD family hydrolase
MAVGAGIDGRRHPVSARSIAVAGSIALVALVAACAPPTPDLAPHGAPFGVAATRNVEIHLADGRVLRANLYEPTDPGTGARASGPFPVIVGLTPYGKSVVVESQPPGSGGVNLDLVRHGYIGVAVDVPGTGVSDGHFDLFDPAEAEAGAEVVRWASALPRSTGSVGMIGHSYSAIDQLFTAAAVGPGSPLKAIFPMAATVDPYRDLFVSGGALNVMSPLGLLFSYGITRSVTPFSELPDDLPTAVRYAAANLEQMSRFEGPIAQDMFDNGPRRYFDDFWRERAPAGVLQQIVDDGVAVHLVGGLYDVFQRGEPLLYSGLQNAAAGRPVDAPMLPDQPVSPRYQLTFGPWTHGGLGAGVDLTAMQLRWFDRWLKGIDDGVDRTTTPLHVIEPGGDTYDAATYPLGESHVERLWLRSERRLTTDPPTAGEPTDDIAYTGVGEPCSASTVQFAAGLFADPCLGPRQRPEAAAGETSYSTPPLAEPLRLAGPIGLTLRAASNRPDTFFAVTLEDVAPDGTSQDLTGGDQLGSLRALDPARSWPGVGDGFLRPYLRLTRDARRPVPIGSTVRYDVEVRPAFATIPAGHRLQLRIATADFPHVIPLADLGDLLAGSYRIHHDAASPSFVELSVLG